MNGDKVAKPDKTAKGKGGPTSLERKNLGRNMSRVKNQKGGR